MKRPKDNLNISSMILLVLALGIFILSSKSFIKDSQPVTVTKDFVGGGIASVVEGTKSLFSAVQENASSTTSTSTDSLATTTKSLVGSKKITQSVGTYLEVQDGCGPYFGGACLSVRNGPGTQYDKLYKLRSGIVLKVVGSETTPNKTKVVATSTEADGIVATTTSYVEDGSTTTWYKVAFDEWIRYPERLNTKNWYVSSDYVREVKATKAMSSGPGAPPPSNKKIVIDRGEQMLYAYDSGEVFMKASVSTGKQGTLTPRGSFTIFNKVPSRYMQGPLPGISEQAYDLPGVPWTMYFTEQGGAIHGAYWHDKFGQEWSHGCVNLPVEKAEKLYEWADIGTVVVVRD